MMRQKPLSIIVICLVVLLLTLTWYSIYHLLHDRTAIEQNLRDQVTSQVSQIKLPKGATGAVGITGNVGAEGLQGPQGPQGLQGSQGVMGPQGTSGANGATGTQGSAGPQGDSGPKGDPGDPGQPGRETEFRCDPATNDYEYRYVGDDSWTIIEKNSNTCKSTVL